MTGSEAVLTSAVLGNPAHVVRQAVDVEGPAVKVPALLLPEVLFLLGARLRVTRAELHPAPHAVLAPVSGPGRETEGHPLTSLPSADILSSVSVYTSITALHNLPTTSSSLRLVDQSMLIHPINR